MSSNAEYDDHWLRMYDLEEDLLRDGPPFEKYFGYIQETVHRAAWEKDPKFPERRSEEYLARLHTHVLELNKKILSEDPKCELPAELAELVILTMQLAQKLEIDLGSEVLQKSIRDLGLPRKR